MSTRLRLVALAVVAAAASAGCDAQSAVPAPRVQGSTAPQGASAPAPTAADRLEDLKPDPGYRVLGRGSGNGAGVVRLNGSAAAVRISYACAGGMIALQFAGQGPSGPCDGQPLVADIDAAASGDALTVTAAAGTRWTVLVQGR